MRIPISINLKPIHTFRYNQVPNFGFNYLLLGKKNQALHTPFECKEYIQDIFYTEYTGNPSDIFGLSWRRRMLSQNAKYFRLAILGGELEMNSRADTMEAFLNEFEKALSIPLTKIHPGTESNQIVIRFSRGWTENALLMSSFTSLVRLSIGYKGEGVNEYVKFLHTLSEEYRLFINDYDDFFDEVQLPEPMHKDVGRIKFTRVNALLHGVRPETAWNSFTNLMYVHDTGMVSSKSFPEVEF